MKECYCGCGTKAKLENFGRDSGIPVDADIYDTIFVCTNMIRGQIIPQFHMQFEFEKEESGNGATIYNRYGDVIHHGAFNSNNCPCIGKRVPI